MVADYYAMLDVDLRADRATIEAALARAQPAWSAGTRNPKNKHKFQSYLDQIPAIRQALLGDPAARAAYDAELAAAARVERDRKLDTLHRLVRLRAARGGLTVSDRTLLRGEADRLGISPGELGLLLQPYPPLPETPADADEPDPPADTIDQATRRQIRIALDHLRRRDLYDVLGLPRDAPASEIAARADAERQKWMHKAQITAEKTAWLEAVSYAQSHLTQPASRARYDRTLVEEQEQAFREAIAFAIRGTTSLAPSTRQVLRDEAAAAGITGDRADRLIDRICRASGVDRDGPGAPARAGGLVRYLRCRSCSGLTEYALASRSSESAICRHCRAPLRWTCPACRRTRWVDESRCVCGFPQEHVEPLIRHFEAAQHAHRNRDYDAALASLRKVQEYAPHHVGARKGVEKIWERLAEIDRARAAYELQRSRRHLIAARAAIASWARLVDPSSPEVRQAFAEVAEGLRRAVALAAKAETVQDDDPHAARVLFRQALSIAADLPEARDGLRLCPPAAPSALHANLVVDRVRLRWTAPPPDGSGPCTYLVRRKRGAVPAHVDDGVALAEVEETEFEDATVLAGDTVGYGVFSVRAGVASVVGAAAGPIPILADVTALRAEALGGEVFLNWTPPANCAEVRVVRKLGSAPTGPEDGTILKASRGEAVDRGLTDDAPYHYGVFALYRAADGRLIASRGVSATPGSPPPAVPIVEPTLSRAGDRTMRIGWPPPECGQVRVFRSTRPLPHPPGARIERAIADAMEGEWLASAAPDHALDRAAGGPDLVYYTPMLSWAGGWTVGRTAVLSDVPDPSDLRAVRTGKAGRVSLRWRWTPGIARVRVVYRAGTAPAGPEDPSALSLTVDEAEYARSGSTTLTLPPGGDGPWHVAVHGVSVVEGREVVSPGLDPSARTVVPGPNSEVAVSYEVRSRLFGRNWSVSFRTDPPGSVIPPTALVVHPRTVPLSVDDGEIVALFPAARDGESFPIRAKINLGAHRLRVFADPQADPEGRPPIRMLHPEAEATRA